MNTSIRDLTVLERVKLFYRALGDGNRSLLDEFLHPEFVGTTTRALPLGLGGVYSSPDQMRKQFWGRLAKHYVARAEVRDIQELADGRFQVSGVYTGRGIKSESELDARFIHLLRFQGEQLIELEQLTDSAAWQEALKPEPTVECHVEDGIALVQLNRPESNNAINQQMPEELLAVAKQCAADPSLRVVVLKGKGSAFTVGGDIKFLSTVAPEELSGVLQDMATSYHDAIRIFHRLPVPVIAAVHGPCAGGGLGLMYCADLVLAADNSRFALGFSALGLSPDGGNSWFLPRLVGARRAAELYFENRVLTAEEAKEWGLVNRVLPLDQLHAEAMSCALRLVKGSPVGLAEARKLLRQSWSFSLSEQLEAEVDSLAKGAREPAVQQAFRAFIDKSKP